MLKLGSMIAFLILFWIILSSQTSSFFIIAAVASILLIFFADKKIFSPLKLCFKLRWLIDVVKLIGDMLHSTYLVTRIILFNKKIESKVEWQTIAKSTDISGVAQANAITLTPGTMAMDMQGNKILVHIISEAK